MRTVYLGTSEFAAAVLERLAESPHRPELVVTRPTGRAAAAASSPRRRWPSGARELGLEVIQPERLHDPSRWSASPRRGRRALVCAYGALIREPLLSHGPAQRRIPRCCRAGAVRPRVERAIMAGDARDRRVDHAPRPRASTRAGGAVQEAEPIRPDDDYGVAGRAAGAPRRRPARARARRAAAVRRAGPRRA